MVESFQLSSLSSDSYPHCCPLIPNHPTSPPALPPLHPHCAGSRNVGKAARGQPSITTRADKQPFSNQDYFGIRAPLNHETDGRMGMGPDGSSPENLNEMREIAGLKRCATVICSRGRHAARPNFRANPRTREEQQRRGMQANPLDCMWSNWLMISENGMVRHGRIR